MFYCEEVSIIVKVECKHAIFHFFGTLYFARVLKKTKRHHSVSFIGVVILNKTENERQRFPII